MRTLSPAFSSELHPLIYTMKIERKSNFCIHIIYFIPKPDFSKWYVWWLELVSEAGNPGGAALYPKARPQGPRRDEGLT